MARDPIPSWNGWTKSQSWDNVEPDREIVRIKREIKAENYRRKNSYAHLLDLGPNCERVMASYTFGPVDLPLDMFTSSRWHERRTFMPLPLDRDGWELCWRNWRGSNSYLAIMAHIERYGMRRPIIAECFVNTDPRRISHRAYAFRGRDPEWPLLILRTGNERLMMAMFEWGWSTIPTTIYVRDCGENAAVSAILRYLADVAPAWLKAGHRAIHRNTAEKESTYGTQ